MELLRSKTVPSVRGYIHDEAALYLLVESNGLYLTVFDLTIFEVVESYPVYTQINQGVKWCVDSNCVYLPTLEGQILAIDKFSGDRLTTMDLGSMVVAGNLAQDEDHVYSLCGLPISNGIKINLQTYAICSNRKSDGKKVYQSQCVEGKTCYFLLNEHIWLVFDKHLAVFDSKFNSKWRNDLSFSPWPPVVTSSFVCFSSALGTLEAFNKTDFQRATRIILPTPFKYQPVDIGSDNLGCITKDGVYKVDLQAKNYELLTDKIIDMSHGAIADDRVIFASGKKGVCVKYRIGGGIDAIDLQKPCSQPIRFGDKIILIATDSVYEIGAQNG